MPSPAEATRAVGTTATRKPARRVLMQKSSASSATSAWSKPPNWSHS